MRYTAFSQVEKEIDNLASQKQYRQIGRVIDEACETFPPEELQAHYFHLLFFKAYFYGKGAMYDEAIAILTELVDKGYACPLHFSSFTALKNHREFAKLSERNTQVLKIEQARAKMEYFVHLPAGYSPEKQYPLFLALHGDTVESMREFTTHWRPDIFIKKEIIFVYVQSSQLICHKGYGWLPDPRRGRQDLQLCYELLLGQYSIDPSQVVIGGFSGGATAAIDMAMANLLPLKGFIALSPDKPENFTRNNVEQALHLGIKGVLLEGAEELPVVAQDEMIHIFNEVGFPYQYVINQGTGHWFPADLDEKLAAALQFILDK